MPALIHCGLAHAQFEIIHPFLDGNGRVGRLLITFLLCQRHILSRPLLYLSLYLKQHRAQYYDRLMAMRADGDCPSPSTMSLASRTNNWSAVQAQLTSG